MTLWALLSMSFIHSQTHQASAPPPWFKQSNESSALARLSTSVNLTLLSSALALEGCLHCRPHSVNWSIEKTPDMHCFASVDLNLLWRRRETPTKT